MITEKGKAILGKYLAGQNDSTFSYIALGVGAVPAYDPFDGDGVGSWSLNSNDNSWYYSRYSSAQSQGYLSEKVDQGFVPEYEKLSVRGDFGSGIGVQIKYSEMKELDFEVVRVPITESGIEYVESTGDGKYFTDIILTATVPSFDRYKFTEIGIYSSESNPIETSKPSQTLFKFAPEENWTGVETETKTSSSPLNTDTAYYPYDNVNFKYFSDDDPPKSQLYSETRVGNWCIALNGVITNNVQSFGFGNIRPTDEFRIAYFINPNEDLSNSSLNTTKSVNITFTDSNQRKAKGIFRTNQLRFDGHEFLVPTHANFGQRYGVGVVRVQDFELTDSTFSWKDVRTVEIEKTPPPDADPRTAPDVILDALRFVSTNYNNPNYGLIAYSVVQNRSGSAPNGFLPGNVTTPNLVFPEPVVKQKGLETLIQYRIRINESLNGEDYVAF